MGNGQSLIYEVHLRKMGDSGQCFPGKLTLAFTTGSDEDLILCLRSNAQVSWQLDVSGYKDKSPVGNDCGFIGFNNVR